MPMLTVHHLGKSQSERIVWLCEELGLPYELKLYDRDPVTRLAPPEYKALHPMGAAPVIDDGGVVLAESGAIIEYLVGRYGAGRLAPAATALEHNLTLVTRDTGQIPSMGVAVFNPWKKN